MASASNAMPLLTVSRARAPSHCCAPRRRLPSGAGVTWGEQQKARRTGGFFCVSHRARTLRAQYRFLPALLHVRQSAAFASGAFQWILLVDDDAFVFVPRLLWILSRLNPSTPLYAGDFGSSGEAAAMRIPHFACGGGGSVLSAAALRLMDVGACLRRYHHRCMQSDWMVGGCARSHNVSELRDLGCGTCDPRRIKDPRFRSGVRARLKADKCFFVQAAQHFARDLPLGRVSAAVVHGLDGPTSDYFFRRHNGTQAYIQ